MHGKGGRRTTTFCVEYPMSKPLRAGIHEVITSYLQARIATGEHVDVAEMAHEIAQSLVDVIMQQEDDGQAALFAFALTTVGEEYLQRHGVFDTKPKGH